MAHLNGWWLNFRNKARAIIARNTTKTLIKIFIKITVLSMFSFNVNAQRSVYSNDAIYNCNNGTASLSPF